MASTVKETKAEEVPKTQEEQDAVPDPLLAAPSEVVREGDHVILLFGDGRQIFAHCVKSWRGKSPPVKINKRSYPTANLVGLRYGTVLELGLSCLNPLPDGEDLVPEHPSFIGATANEGDSKSEKPQTQGNAKEAAVSDYTTVNDNRNLTDSNTSQTMQYNELQQLRKSGAHGSTIVGKLIKNSSTFDKKTEFSKAKYVMRKVKKYQPRCRMVRCTAATICEALFMKEPRKLMNLRDDTLGQILSYSNICAGCQTLVFETGMGVITGSVAERMGGYGKVISLYSGQQPACMELLSRFNLSFAEQSSIKWAHTGDIFGDDAHNNESEEDTERLEREQLIWPCPLQDHTRRYLESMASDRERTNFLDKRCARFARKLTRHTPLEANHLLCQRKCDSVIIATKYDPTATLLELLPYLAPSSPFVIFCEFIEPLTECFRELQKQSLAINLRLSDTWTREYQVLPGRTHPNMTVSQSGGFILTGIKLCPVTGQNELEDALVKEIRSEIGGRRGKKSKHKKDHGNEGSKNYKKRKASGGRDNKQPEKKPTL